ncbi:hypothetical protein ACTRXD_01335 [Nitrospira sp. T9]|uniref:hypothetical protein n=1 Tax=unclassified Nitrospira TaxID=2652172 RepID=UPI003F9E544C
MGDKKFVVEKVSPAVKIETDEQGREFIANPDTGKRMYFFGIAKNFEEALALTIEEREKEKRKEQNPDSTFPQDHA